MRTRRKASHVPLLLIYCHQWYLAVTCLTLTGAERTINRGATRAAVGWGLVSALSWHAAGKCLLVSELRCGRWASS